MILLWTNRLGLNHEKQRSIPLAGKQGLLFSSHCAFSSPGKVLCTCISAITAELASLSAPFVSRAVRTRLNSRPYNHNCQSNNSSSYSTELIGKALHRSTLSTVTMDSVAASRKTELPEESRPTVGDLQGDNHYVRVAKENWLETPSSKVRQDVLKRDLWDVLETEHFAFRSLLTLESLQILER